MLRLPEATGPIPTKQNAARGLMSSEVFGGRAGKLRRVRRAAACYEGAMRTLAMLLVASVALAACDKPLRKAEMFAGCEAAARATATDLAGAPIDFRAVVGREAILRFLAARPAGAPAAVSVKCKVDRRGELRRLTIDSARITGGALDDAREAFAAARS
jgi:hypothetical protein